MHGFPCPTLPVWHKRPVTTPAPHRLYHSLAQGDTLPPRTVNILVSRCRNKPPPVANLGRWRGRKEVGVIPKRKPRPSGAAGGSDQDRGGEEKIKNLRSLRLQGDSSFGLRSRDNGRPSACTVNIETTPASSTQRAKGIAAAEGMHRDSIAHESHPPGQGSTCTRI